MAELLAAHPQAGQPLHAGRVNAVVGGRTHQHLLEVAHVAVHVASIRVQVDDGIADDLSGAVVGDVAAAAVFEHVDAACRERVRRRENVRASAVAAHAERQDVRMLDEEEQIADAPRAPVVHERALQRQRIGIRDQAKAPHLDGPTRFTHRTCLTHLPHLTYLPYLTHPTYLPCRPRQMPLGSQFSSDVFTIDMNSSATAPSITRWS